MANIQQYFLSYTEWKALSGTAYYIDYGTFYALYKVDTTLANQIIYGNKLFYVLPLTSTQQTNLADFQTTVLGTATQVDSVDEIVNDNF